MPTTKNTYFNDFEKDANPLDKSLTQKKLQPRNNQIKILEKPTNI